MSVGLECEFGRRRKIEEGQGRGTPHVGIQLDFGTVNSSRFAGELPAVNGHVHRNSALIYTEIDFLSWLKQKKSILFLRI